MSYTAKRSKALAHLAEVHSDLVELYEVEEDGYGEDTSGPFSHWIYLRSPFVCTYLDPLGLGVIHESIVSEALAQLRDVIRRRETRTGE